MRRLAIAVAWVGIVLTLVVVWGSLLILAAKLLM